MALLDVENLSVSFSIQGRRLHAVQGVSFQLHEGEAIGIVGESGCGKSALVQSLLRLIPSKIETGKVLFNGVDLLQLPPDKLRAVRGAEIGMIFQDPMTSLNPTMRIGAQIVESILYHRMAGPRAAKERAIELLRLTGVPDPQSRFSQFPHQLSGGLRQRALIAIALAANPRVLIADEPTTALDPTIQAQILHLLKELRSHFKMSQIIITHDIGAVSSLCDRVLVMYAGKIVEEGTAQEVLTAPRHPYTKMLLHSIPRLSAKQGEKLFAIEGSPPSLFTPPPGCPFAARCPHAMNICAREFPPANENTACWLYNHRYNDALAADPR
jgi:oligopeptide transport system ATP-binding protein